MNITLVSLNGHGSFEAYESDNGVIIVMNGRKFMVCFDSKDQAYIGIEGNKCIVTWF